MANRGDEGGVVAEAYAGCNVGVVVAHENVTPLLAQVHAGTAKIVL